MHKAANGYALAAVLVLLGLGALAITPTLQLAFASIRGKEVHTDILKDQYARDGAAEFGIWLLNYGDATQLLIDPAQCPDSTCSMEVVLNGITTTVTMRMLTELGTIGVPGAEDNKIRTEVTVECDKDGDGFDDDCLNLPLLSGMVARYTIKLTQLSPDTSAALTAVYDQLPSQFDYRPGTVNSPDGSFPEIPSVTPTNIGSATNEIWKWDFSSAPISFQQDQARTFRFEADIRSQQDRYCNGVFLKMSPPPHEKTDKQQAQVMVGSSPPAGCDGGGVLSEKFVDQFVAPPNVTTIFTYIANVEVFENNSMKLDSVKDVLPQGGFQWCNPISPPAGFTCDAAMYKIVSDPFDPQTGSFTDTTGYTPLAAPVETLNNGRWELFWDNGGGGWNLAQAGQAGDTFVMRFQAHVTPTASGSYYNELFADADCSAPQPLINEGVTSQQEYCASYSWPTGVTLVPMYEFNSAAERTYGQGTVTVGVGGISLESWHVENK